MYERKRKRERERGGEGDIIYKYTIRISTNPNKIIFKCDAAAKFTLDPQFCKLSALHFH